jgi:hypothetical protein
VPNTNAGYPYIDGSELVKNWPAALQALAVAVGDMPIPRFTDATARNSALGSTTNGRFAYLTSTSQLTMCDGTGWIVIDEPTQSYTPTFTGITLGNGTVSGSYNRSGGRCFFTARFVLGTTSAVTGAMTVTTPTVHAATRPGMLAGSMFDTSAGLEYPCGFTGEASAISTVKVYALSASSSFVSISNPSSTVPFTWATTDEVNVTGWYPMNTRYL